MNASDDRIATTALTFVDDGAIPNHPAYPFLVHRGAFDASVAGHDAAVERIKAVPLPATDPVFGSASGLRAMWRNDDAPTGADASG